MYVYKIKIDQFTSLKMKDVNLALNLPTI